MMSIERCYEMSQLAGIAYLDGKAAKKLYKKMGWNGHKFIEVKGAQCHVIWDSKEMAICFRGTEPDEFSDIKADLNAWPDTAHNGHGKVHNGFQEEINKIWHNILEVMEAQKCYHLYICGHSLGGAMATIAASRLGDKVSARYTHMGRQDPAIANGQNQFNAHTTDMSITTILYLKSHQDLWDIAITVSYVI